jgi:large subunit ribosomal protein L3
MKAMYGKKLGMTRLFTENGESVPVTVLELSPNVVYQVKTQETDGYAAVQIGIGSQKPQRVNRAQTSHFAKAKKGMPQHVSEIRLDRQGRESDEQFQIGDEITMENRFEVGNKVDITGTSVGKGFAGVIKRHGMKGAQTMSHGTHESFRHAGSIGCRKFPGRVFKNKRMAGHMGAEQVTQPGLEVVDIRPDHNLLLVKGSVPGPKRGIVFVQSSVKN